MKNAIFALLALLGTLAVSSANSQIALQKNGVPYMPEEWLISQGQPYHFRGLANQNVKSLNRREPTSPEAKSINSIRQLFQRYEFRALLLGDGDSIVFDSFKPPVTRDSFLLSASIDKSVTSVSAGVAICQGKISLQTSAVSVIPQLQGTDIGESTVRDLLTMTSGTDLADDIGSSFTVKEFEEIQSGKKSYLDLMKSKWKSRALFKSRGRSFDYKAQDPILLGMVIGGAYGLKFRDWQADNLFNLLGLERYQIQGTDRYGFASADSNTRMTIQDWARFAVFVQQRRNGQDCLGNFLREATVKQISNDGRFLKEYGSYGYLFWTDPQGLPDAYAALGHGGQAIIWSKSTGRYLVAFSVSTRQSDVLEMAKLWLSLP